MKAITVKVPDDTLERLRRDARALGVTLSELIRSRIEERQPAEGASVYERTKHLCGIAEGSGISATNDRPKFRR